MTLFHATERLGKVQSVSREGFLICEGVPVSRTGDLLYAPGELPIPPGPDGLIHVHRSEDAVFHPDAISSFEGKSIVDLHPGVDVTPANWRMYAVGHMQNVRRGTGDQSHVLLADLVIKDAAAIREVRAGKRQVSLGYEAAYVVTKPGFADQTEIIGNHVALVPQGRCGPTCSIGDEAMSTTQSRTWMDRVRSAFTANDETMLAAALAEAPMPGSNQGGTTVHLHTGDKEASPPPVSGEVKEFVKNTADALGLINSTLKDLGAKFSVLDTKVQAMATRDKELSDAEKKAKEEQDAKDAKAAEEAAEAKASGESAAAKAKKDEDDAEEERKKKAKTGDSAGLATAFQECVARAEILIPGVTIPTFDAKATPQATDDMLCGFKRRVLTSAQVGGGGKMHVDALVGPGADLSAMTCDAVSVVFTGATELAKAANNRSGAHTANLKDTSTRKGPLSNSEINERNRKYYNLDRK